MSLQVEIEKKLNDKVLSVSFDTEGKQGITGILGASGCGKSMTLKCIAYFPAVSISPAATSE